MAATTGSDLSHSEPSASRGLAITMESPGHWHVTRSKHLLFHVTDAAGNGVSGLKPRVSVRTLSGDVEQLTVTDGGGGTYAARYTAWEIGSGYATSYSAVFSAEHEGRTYLDAWPFEVVRDGREDIFKGDGRYSYQVRYGWVPGRPVADGQRPVTFCFEPRRALKEGDALDHKQPWRTPSEHLPGLAATVVITSADGAIHDELPAIYSGLGVYTAEHVFSPDEVGAGREYVVSFVFTDPYNEENIGVEDNAYPLQVLGA